MADTGTRKLLIITGPTASGKSSMAMEIASAIGGEIINADSVQVYRGMDIGTAKPSIEERASVSHHLIDIRDPDQPFSAAEFAHEAARAIDDIVSRGKYPIVVGGTGLYIRALVKGLIDVPPGGGAVRERLMEEARSCGNDFMHRRLESVDPLSASRIHPNNLVRVVRALEHFEMTGTRFSSVQEKHGFPGGGYDVIQLAIALEREELNRRIDRRVDRMMTDGFVDEVRAILEKGYSRHLKPMGSIGYREICSFLAGEIKLDHAADEIRKNTRRYARRQVTWLKSEPSTVWVAYPENSDTILRQAYDFFQ